MTKIIAKEPERIASENEADDHLLTKAEFAKRVNVSVRTVESWMAEKLIPYVKIKKTVRFNWPDVQEALKRGFGIGYGHQGMTPSPPRR